MKTKCPHCNTVQKAPDEATGKKALCRSCRQKFTIAEYAPPVIVPIADLPSPADLDDIPITVDAPPPKDRDGNILSRAWLGIPAPFKTSFLATLGVVSALLFAWYVVRVPKWFNPPPTAPTPAGRQLADADIPSAQLLTELIRCYEGYGSLDTVQLARAAFGKQASNNPSLWLNSAKPNIAVITEIILTIEDRPPCTDAGMRLCSSQIRDALLAELRYQKYIANLADGTRAANATTIKALVGDAVRRTDLAYETLVFQTARFGVFE